jgi:hypothetical protein
MAGSDSERELDVAEIIAKVRSDDKYSPEHRADRVYEYLKANPEFTNWDLLCFAAEYTGSMAGALPWLLQPAKDLVRVVYIAHYIRFEDIAWLDKQTSDAATQASSTETDEKKA